MSFVAWRGPSPVTGDPLVLVVSGPSRNAKTGPMYQAWLLVAGVDPFTAVATGADAAICGACVHRAGPKRTCYVSLFNGPAKLARAANTGTLAELDLEDAAAALAGGQLRVTAYGDPAFVPFEVWDALLARAAGWAGYTHQWRTCDPRFRALLMASVDSPAERAEAAAAGWRTFRTRAHGAAVLPGEFVCPASDEGGHRTTCARCQLCRGTSSPAKSVVIELHGRGAVGRGGWPRASYDELRAAITVFGTGEIYATAADRGRIALALRQYYRRRQEPAQVRSRRIDPDTYRFWIEAPEAPSR